MTNAIALPINPQSSRLVLPRVALVNPGMGTWVKFQSPATASYRLSDDPAVSPVSLPLDEWVRVRITKNRL